MEVEVALQWNTGFYEGIHSFANGISTIEGGMHEEGFKKSLTNVAQQVRPGQGTLKEKDENLLGEDIREGLTAIVSVRLQDPQFEGQTKAKLGNVPMRSLVERATNEKLAEWLEENPTRGRPDHPEGMSAARARVAAQSGPRRSPGASPRSRAPGCPASSRTARRGTPDESRAVHRGGRLGRRVGHRARNPADPGHPAHPGQDPQRRTGPDRQDAQEHRDPGPHRRHRRRAGRGLRRRPRPATTRSSSWPTPTSTAATSAPCC